MNRLSVARGACIAAYVFMYASTTLAATCMVPSPSHSTIQAAVDDGACTTVQLEARGYAESAVITRSLLLKGALGGETYIEGHMQVTSGQVQIADLDINSPGTTYAQALLASNGAEVSATNVVVRNGMAATILLIDGFETGDTSAWTSVTP